MALHPNFPRSPYDVLPPELRWFPAAEELRSTAYEKLASLQFRVGCRARRRQGKPESSPGFENRLSWPESGQATRSPSSLCPAAGRMNAGFPPSHSFRT